MDVGDVEGDVNRRQLLSSLLITPAVAAVVASCGDDRIESGVGSSPTDPPGPDAPTTIGPPTSAPPATAAPAGPIDRPTGADDVVLALRNGVGGFVMEGVAFTNVPQLLITGDGRAFSAAPQIAIFPGPLLPPIAVRTITPEGVDKILQLAAEAGLVATPPDYSSEIMVTDVGSTELLIEAGGGRFLHVAEALGFNVGPDGQPAEETSPARQDLAAFVALLGDLPSLVGAEALGEETILEADTFRLQARPVNLADYEGQEIPPEIVDWPADAGVRLADATDCATTDDPAIAALFRDATQLTLFVEDGQHHSIAAVAQLPGDAC